MVGIKGSTLAVVVCILISVGIDVLTKILIDIPALLLSCPAMSFRKDFQLHHMSNENKQLHLPMHTLNTSAIKYQAQGDTVSKRRGRSLTRVANTSCPSSYSSHTTYRRQALDHVQDEI
ncbi:hypothetical protein F4782DRAFT_358862 [Xylaria castorea]|nr:hypothetical protein F4782DRAFT_358862 [Xylaria castorea]